MIAYENKRDKVIKVCSLRWMQTAGGHFGSVWGRSMFSSELVSGNHNLNDDDNGISFFTEL